jgi:hypothetical protein
MFDHMGNVETKQRIQDVLDRLEPSKRKQFEALSAEKDAFYYDAKTFLARKFEAILADEEESPEQIRVNLVLAATHTMLRAISQLSLATAETIVFGEPQADIEMESSRIIEVGDLWVAV